MEAKPTAMSVSASLSGSNPKKPTYGTWVDVEGIDPYTSQEAGKWGAHDHFQ